MEKNEFEVIWNEFINERVENSYKDLLNDSKFKGVIERYNQLYCQLKKTIRNNEILEQYKNAELDSYTMQLLAAYKMGFKDSFAILTN